MGVMYHKKLLLIFVLGICNNIYYINPIRQGFCCKSCKFQSIESGIGKGDEDINEVRKILVSKPSIANPSKGVPTVTTDYTKANIEVKPQYFSITNITTKTSMSSEKSSIGNPLDINNKYDISPNLTGSNKKENNDINNLHVKNSLDISDSPFPSVNKTEKFKKDMKIDEPKEPLDAAQEEWKNKNKISFDFTSVKDGYGQNKNFLLPISFEEKKKLNICNSKYYDSTIFYKIESEDFNLCENNNFFKIDCFPEEYNKGESYLLFAVKICNKNGKLEYYLGFCIDANCNVYCGLFMNSEVNIEILMLCSGKNLVDLENMFYKNINLQKIKFKPSFEYCNVNNMSYMCNSCSRLEEVVFPNNFECNGLKNLSYVFAKCSNLTNVNFGDNFKTMNVEDFSFMFSNCEKLKSLCLSMFETNNLVNISGMFSGCKVLFGLYINKFNIDKVDTNKKKDVFKDCFELDFIQCKNDKNIGELLGEEYVYVDNIGQFKRKGKLA